MVSDFLIIGGGIVGMAVAHELLTQRPGCTVLVLEKEAAPAQHQTGRNSGVIHSGIYYPPGSDKARLCRTGRRRLIDFCEQQGIPYELCGKLIVATRPSELPQIDRLLERSRQNGLVGCRRLAAEQIPDYEPHAAGLAALHVPQTGIVDYRLVTQRLMAQVQERGGQVLLSHAVTGIVSMEPSGRRVLTTGGDYEARFLINCAGLHSDRIARMDGLTPDAAIIPFRGEYFALRPEFESLVRHLIYPVPDSAFPFLGVHFTRMVGGGVECGPNAVLAGKREGYRKTEIGGRDVWDILRHPGFRRLARRYWRMGVFEMYRSVSKRAFSRSLQRLIPAVRPAMLIPAPAGVRAQAITPDGRLVDDFLFAEGRQSLHVLNAPSPAATASLAIAETIVRRCPILA
ncbi:MAG: L-2-hydroxyglutarate oxidase [Armatimonadetes bacterium]|nr:L-2-hydroxyglutarate oxidase [Armatimonadota bacterium]